MTTIIVPSTTVYSPWVETRRNRCINPAFGASTSTGWNNWGPGTGMTGADSYVTDTDFGRARRYTITAPGNGALTMSMALTADPVDLATGDNITVSMFVRSTKAVTVTPTVQHYVRSTSTLVGAVNGSAVTLTPGEWTRVSASGIVPETATTSRLIITVATNALLVAADTFDVTGSASELSPLGDYFDGSTTGDDLTRYSWAGTANASASIQETRRAIQASPTILLDLVSERESRTVVHPVLGRPWPDVTLRDAGVRTGTLRLGFQGDDAEVLSKDAEDMHALPDVFTIFTDERDTLAFSYVLNGRVTRRIEDESRDAWIVEVDYQEVTT